LSRAVFERGPDRPEAYPTRVHRLWSPRLAHYCSHHCKVALQGGWRIINSSQDAKGEILVYRHPIGEHK